MIQDTIASNLTTEAFYTALFKALPGNSALLLAGPPVFTIVAVTAGFIQTSGKSKEELLGKGLFEAFPNSPDDPEQASEKRLRASLSQVLQDKEVRPVPLHRYDIPAADGSFDERWWSTVNQPVLNNAGEVLYIVHSAEDVTAKIKAEQREQELKSVQSAHEELQSAYARLHESEEKYRTLFNSIDQGFCVIKMMFDGREKPVDYRFLEINPAFEKQTGLHDATGKTMRQLIPYHEDNWFAMYGSVALKGEPVHFVQQAAALNRWFDVYAFRMGKRERFEVAILFTDITERKKVEEELRQAHERTVDILEGTTDAFYAVDAGFNFTYINKRAAQLWGRDCDALIGKYHWTEFPKAVGSESYHKHYEAIKEARPVHYETVSPVLGTWIGVSIYPGTNGSLSVFFRDITERKHAEEALERKVKERTLELERLNGELKRSNQNSEKFAHAASHDLKEPIRKIHFFTHQLKDQLKAHISEVELRFFGRIENATEQMGNLIDDLLLYSHVSWKYRWP